MTTLEEGRPLSESVLWRLQREFFEQRGLDAWIDGIVPDYVTSNRFIARSYARLVRAYLSECGDGRAHIVELGAGAGRFAYHFLSSLLPLDREVRYVLTDFSERTVEEWQSHPWLRRLADDGVLDFALFDAEHPGDIVLTGSGEVLAPDGPLVVIANYVFDSIPHDCFAVRGGQLLEGLARVSAADDPEQAPLDTVEVAFEFAPVRRPRFEDARVEEVLESYGELGDRTFLFPTSSLACIRHFRVLARDTLLVLAADQGHCRAEQLRPDERPMVLRHGSVSVMVNFHAIGEYVRRLGGGPLHPPFTALHLTVAAYVFGAGTWTATRDAYESELDGLGPDAFFTLRKALEPHYADFTIEQLLAVLRLSEWDSYVFLGMADELVTRAESAPELHDDLRRAAHAVWDGYLPIGATSDLPYAVGLLLSRIGRHDEALWFFGHSLHLHGKHPSTAFNLANCQYVTGHVEQALFWLKEALELDPELEEAIELRDRIARETSGASAA